MFVTCGYKSPGILFEQRADEIFGLFCNLFKTLLIKLPLGGGDQGEGLDIVVTLERRLTAESERNKRQ